jgi:hypothetical protein
MSRSAFIASLKPARILRLRSSLGPRSRRAEEQRKEFIEVWPRAARTPSIFREVLCQREFLAAQLLNPTTLVGPSSQRADRQSSKSGQSDDQRRFPSKLLANRMRPINAASAISTARPGLTRRWHKACHRKSLTLPPRHSSARPNDAPPHILLNRSVGPKITGFTVNNFS